VGDGAVRRGRRWVMKRMRVQYKRARDVSRPSEVSRQGYELAIV
jgi:hypothetical protein